MQGGMLSSLSQFQTLASLFLSLFFDVVTWIKLGLFLRETILRHCMLQWPRDCRGGKIFSLQTLSSLLS